MTVILRVRNITGQFQNLLHFSIEGDTLSTSFLCDFHSIFTYVLKTHIMILFSESASFMLTSKAFRKPSLYKGKYQTQSDVREIIDYMVDGVGDIGIKVRFSLKGFHQ